MGQVLITGVGGGANPDEITARAGDVIEGKTTIDENGEVVKGNIKNMSGVTQCLDRVVFDNGHMWLTIPNGAYVANSWTGHPEIGITKDKLVKALGVEDNKILSDKNIAGIQGTIPISRTNKNHVKTMNDGFAWSDDRGLMYVIRIDDNCYIPPVSQNGYNYVGIIEPNLRPENIKQGTTIGRVRGTMTDGSSGRVVFNGATFDGQLVSGVADNNNGNRCGIICSNVVICYKNNINSKHFGSYSDRQYDVNGIRDGGLNVYVRNNSTNRGGYEDLKAGYILKESVNLTPFRRIKIGYKILNPRTYTIDDARNGNPHIKAHLTVVLGIMSIHEINNTRHSVEFDVLYSKNNKLVYKDHYFSDTRNIREGNGTQQYLEIDISDKQGHFYIGFGAGAEILYDTQGSVIFNHIEFIN